MSTQLRSTTKLASGYNSLGAASGSQAYAYAQPHPRTPPEERRPRRLSKERYKTLRASTDAHRSILLNVGGLLGAAAVIGFAFLNGHIQLAKEAHRSVLVTQHLNQALDMEHAMQNQHARLITPTTIGQKAAGIGMTHPDERDVVPFP